MSLSILPQFLTLLGHFGDVAPLDWHQVAVPAVVHSSPAVSHVEIQEEIE